MQKEMKIALIGNPNSGKTTMFNSLTGASAYVGNWPGVTVEKKEGYIKGNKNITLIDLPGIYSLSPYTPEEIVTRDFLIKETPDVIINIVDASNIERNLYLTLQLIETEIPVIIALNMMDVVDKNGDKIDVKSLSKILGCEVLKTSAVRDIGLKDLIEKSKNTIKKSQVQTLNNKNIIQSIEAIKMLIGDVEHSNYIAIKLFERDKKIISDINISPQIIKQIEQIILSCEKSENDDGESIIISERYSYIETIISRSFVKNKSGIGISQKIDRILTNKYLALPIFGFIMWAIYYVSVSSIGATVTDWTNDVLFGGYVTEWFSAGLNFIGAADWLHSLVIDGIVGGVGAVLGFVPQLFILFFFLSILEDSGYMARVAFIMDKIFRGFGLSGKSFIPMMISSGCGVPGIMSSRTIENESERKLTIMVTTFIPCSAKLPIIALIAGAFFPTSSLIAPSVYFLGILMIAISGMILKKTKMFNGENAPFVMELPQYHLPRPKNVAKHIFDRVKSFIIKAGTIIFVASGVIWFLSNFNFSFIMVDTSDSMLAVIGGFIAPIFAPIGFDSWQAAVATVTGLLAKENVVGTLGVLFGVSEFSQTDATILSGMASIFTTVGAYSFMAFNMICAPCFAAVGAIRREMGSLKWTMIAVLYQTLLAYVISFIIYQFGTVFFMGTSFVLSTWIALFLVLIIVWLIMRPNNNLKGRV